MGLSFVRAGGIALFLGLGQGLGQGLGVGLGLSLGIIYQLYQVRNQQEKPHRQVGGESRFIATGFVFRCLFFCLTLMWINSDSFSCLISDLLMCRYYLIISENILILPFFSFVKIMTFSELYFKNILINNYTEQAFVQTRKKTRD